ncbi:MAG: hypothetical protein IJH34_05235 [Romboutsia sp.]|nr:hypothetical protein [Romboutsia sp.]
MSEEHKLAIKDTIIKTIKKEERKLLFRGIRRFTSIVIVSTIICHVLELDKSKYTSPLITCTLATTIVELYFRKKKLYSILGSNYFEKCKQKILEPKELELRIQCSNLKSILLNLGFIEFDGGIKDYEFL